MPKARQTGGYVSNGYEPLQVADAPTTTGASAGSQTASVEFTPPADTGGAAIDNYYAVSSPGGITASSVTSPIEVTGLTNGTEYTFKVWGQNSYGPSAYSNTTSGVTPAASYVEDVFSTYAVIGNAPQTVTNGINLASNGGMVWTKTRASVDNNYLVDSGRGLGYYLVSNVNLAQGAQDQFITSFNSNGFSYGNAGYTGNSSLITWTFRKAEKFFDVVTWTGNGVNGRQIPHNLGVAPGCLIVRCASNAEAWLVWHRSLTNKNYLVQLNTTNPQYSDTRLNINTAPTDTYFEVGTDGEVNLSGRTYVAYLFAHNAGGFGESGTDSIISCGAINPDGSGNATVTLGWEPQWVLTKRIDSSTGGDWRVYDNIRGMYTGQGGAYVLKPSSDAADLDLTGYSGICEPLPTGFYGNANSYYANAKYIYIAIRRGPMKTPTDATKVFGLEATDGDGGQVVAAASYPSDLFVARSRGDGYNNWFTARLTNKLLASNLTNAQSSNTYWTFDVNAGAKLTTPFNGGIFYNFSRAPGFFDVATYTGNGVARTIQHNLGVVPELMFVKSLGAVRSWNVYHKDAGNTVRGLFNSTNYWATDSTVWNNTTPTSSVFTVGTAAGVNNDSENFIAYLFASCPGVSKVGGYTGTGSLINIDCGFASGARFVFIKRTDSTGNWRYFDTARGISASTDPSLNFNDTAAETNEFDFIDTYASGFTVDGVSPNLGDVNAVGGSYIYLAIA